MPVYAFRREALESRIEATAKPITACRGRLNLFPDHNGHFEVFRGRKKHLPGREARACPGFKNAIEGGSGYAGAARKHR